ncbi:MAG: hypothetical protein ACKOB4_13985 [Acidobacteriota bacterium]
MVDKSAKSDQDQSQRAENWDDPHYENSEQLDLFLSLRVQNFLQEFQAWLNSPLTTEEEELIKAGKLDPDLDE